MAVQGLRPCTSNVKAPGRFRACRGFVPFHRGTACKSSSTGHPILWRRRWSHLQRRDDSPWCWEGRLETSLGPKSCNLRSRHASNAMLQCTALLASQTVATVAAAASPKFDISLLPYTYRPKRDQTPTSCISVWKSGVKDGRRRTKDRSNLLVVSQGTHAWLQCLRSRERILRVELEGQRIAWGRKPWPQG